MLEEIVLDETELDESLKVPSRKRRRTDIDDRIHTILDEVQNMVTVPDRNNDKRHASFGAYLIDRMEMLPLQVARDLEVEFISRVNTLLDIHAD